MQKYFHVLFEKHIINCCCSYCKGDSKLHYGLNIPKCRKWNSWWVLKYYKRRYIRVAFTFLKNFKF